MAMVTRWRMPPDSWCGYSSSRRSGSGMPTVVEQLLGRVLGLVLGACRGGGVSDSVICRPIFMTGFSDVIGSWKTIAISVPQTSRICFGGVGR